MNKQKSDTLLISFTSEELEVLLQAVQQAKIAPDEFIRRVVKERLKAEQKTTKK